MKQPEGFTVEGENELGCKLNKSLYSLKKSLMMWYQNFDMYNQYREFVKSQANHCVHGKK